MNVAGDRTGRTLSVTHPRAAVNKLNQHTGHVVRAQQAVDYADAERSENKTGKLRGSVFRPFVKPAYAQRDRGSIGGPYGPHDGLPRGSPAPSISAGALPLNVICDVAQHRHGLQRDFKLQLSVLHLQLLHQATKSVRERVKQSAEVCTMTAGPGWITKALYLHGGHCGVYGRAALLAVCRSLPGGFAGQQGEFAVAVIHQVNNTTVSCLAAILHNTKTLSTYRSSEATSGLQLSPCET